MPPCMAALQEHLLGPSESSSPFVLLAFSAVRVGGYSIWGRLYSTLATPSHGSRDACRAMEPTLPIITKLVPT
jgi:hypothetical protein